MGGTQEVLPRDDEPLVVPDDVGAEPLGAGRRADEREQPARRHLLRDAGVLVGEREFLEVAVARPATTSLRYRTSILGTDVILSTRYRDIVPASVAARTTSTTRLA